MATESLQEKEGKLPPPPLKTLFVEPNNSMLSIVAKEEARLKNIAVSFVVVERDNLSGRKFFYEWIFGAKN